MDFNYDLNKELDNILTGTNAPTQQAAPQASMGTQQMKMGSAQPVVVGQASSTAKQSSDMRAPVNNGGLTQYVPIADPNHGKLQVLVDDPYLGDFENDLKMRVSETRK